MITAAALLFSLVLSGLYPSLLDLGLDIGFVVQSHSRFSFFLRYPVLDPLFTKLFTYPPRTDISTSPLGISWHSSRVATPCISTCVPESFESYALLFESGQDRYHH
ncbi:hypothetical protein BDN67DRAFT_363238 [Paxillus ammoniavirescens]|nr:hypothetical protein BDN67DRAFT_363238 [Paxillus ammoniavirescens]